MPEVTLGSIQREETSTQFDSLWFLTDWG